MDSLGEIKIVDSLMLPDSCDLTMFINSYDKVEAAEAVDAQPFKVGAQLVVKAGAIDDRAPTKVIFDGMVARRRRRLRPRRHHARHPRVRPRPQAACATARCGCS